MHTALTPTIGIGSLEWMDTSYVYCIHNCIDLEMYSSIHINLCYAVWSTIWLFIFVSSIVFEHNQISYLVVVRIWGSGKVRIFVKLFVCSNHSNKNSKFCCKKIKKLGQELRRTFPRTLKNLAKNFEDSFEVLAKFWPSFFDVLCQVSLMFLANLLIFLFLR